MYTFKQFIKDNKQNLTLQEIKNNWETHQKEGTFLNGEHTPLDTFQSVYFRGSPGDAFKYQVINTLGKVENYVSIKHHDWNRMFWNVIETPIENLNIVCY